jgi:hypothetical protein
MMRERIALVLVAALVLCTAVWAPGARWTDEAAAQESELGIMSYYTTVQDAVIEQTVWSFTGWGLAAIGLNFDQDQPFNEIESELETISDQLTEIDDELEQLNEEILQETCDMQADTTTSARADIDTYASEYYDFITDGATPAQLDEWADDVLGTDGDGTTGVLADLETINDGLLPAGNSDGVLTACIEAMTGPTAGTAGDTDYYDDVSNLTMFFYGYQAKGLGMLVEAYHYKAYEEWSQSNDISSVDPNTDGTFCTSATSSDSWYSWCEYAVNELDDLYEDLQTQFALAGAPYTVEDEAVTINGTDYVLVESLEDFSAAQGSSCATPLLSDAPCGPTTGTNLTTSFTMSDTYAWRTDWAPASAVAWQSVNQWWTTSDQTLGEYLSTNFGMDWTDGYTKIILTPTTYDATITTVVNAPHPTFDAGCFLDTSLEKSFAHQPFCYNGSYDGNDYGEASDLLSHGSSYDYEGLDCPLISASSTLTDESTSSFYEGTYKNPFSFCPTGWENDVQPGWVLDSSGATDSQYLWPSFDMSTATCNTNDDGSTRSNTNPGGVYTMCGDDFDLWFAEIVPAVPSADVSPDEVSAGDSVTVTSSGWDDSTDMTVTLNSTPVELDHTTVDDKGRLTRTYTVPLDSEVGLHHIELAGTWKGRSFTLSVPLTVIQRTTPRFAG